MGLLQPTPDPDHPGSCVVYTSLRGLFGAVVTPLILLALGITATAASGTVRAFPVVLIALGAVLGLIVAFDYPRNTRFDHAGISRVCLARTQHLPWSDIVAIERTPRRTLSRLRQLTSRGDSDQHLSGGLVARGRGKVRWMLSDRVESVAEHDRVRHVLDHLDVPVMLRAGRPPEAAPPTDLYRPNRRR